MTAEDSGAGADERPSPTGEAARAAPAIAPEIEAAPLAIDAPSASREAGALGGDSTYERALALAFRYLNRRDRTRSEMGDHLAAKGFPEAVIAMTLEELGGQGYLDDGRFARLFAEDKRRLDGWGSERIARTLRERGVGREHIVTALSAEGGAEEPETERDRALAVLARRFPVPPCNRREQERAFAVLVRKGYESDVARAAVRAHVAGAA